MPEETIHQEIATGTKDFIQTAGNTAEGALPQIIAPKMKDLGLRNKNGLAASNAQFDPKPLVEEMTACAPVKEIEIDGSYSIIVGTTYALDPHTYLTVPMRTMFDAVAKGYTAQEGRSGFPPSISASNDAKLSLHLVNWCFIKTNKDGKINYEIIDALSFFAGAEKKLKDLGCSVDNEKIGQVRSEVYQEMGKRSAINRTIIKDVFNNTILDKLVEAILSFDTDNPGVIHFPEAAINKREYLINLFYCRAGDIMTYTNIGHSPQADRDMYDTARGPATLEPYHEFCRYIPLKAFAKLFGTNDETIAQDQYGHLNALVAHLGTRIPQLVGERFMVPVTLRELIAGNKLSEFIKLLDPYSNYVATYASPLFRSVLAQLISQSGIPAAVSYAPERDHATALTAGHSHPIRIEIGEQTADQLLDDASFAQHKLKELLPSLTSFFSLLDVTYKNLFEEILMGEWTPDQIRKIISKHVHNQSLTINDTELQDLAHAIAQIRPTSRMTALKNKAQVSAEVEGDGLIKTKAEITRLQQLLEVLKICATEEGAVTTIVDALNDNTLDATAFSLALSDRIAISEQECGPLIDYFQQHIVHKPNVSEAVFIALAHTALALERQGQRVGVRSFNLPKIPGFLLGYRIGTENGRRKLIVKISLSLGQRGSMEGSGVILVRAVDTKPPDTK